MLYFTNQELATTYHVSVRTVRNWIESAKAGKLDLTLIPKGERTYIANISKNSTVMQELAENGKKFRPHRAHKIVTPKPEFYELYNQEQLYEIVSSLEINREIPRQYNYFDEGAKNWDVYVQKLADEESPNNLKATVHLLSTNLTYIDNLLAQYDQINIIDVGVGNALPVKELLTHLLERNKLGRYIAIDISPTMLDIAEKNVNKWFGDKVKFEGHAVDIDHDRFGNLLAEEYIKTNAARTTNVLLFLGGTIQNFKKPGPVFKVLHDSMGVNDFLIHQQKLDTLWNRRQFNFSPTPAGSTLAPIHRYIFDLFNIDGSLYEMDMGYDTKSSERYIRAILKVALSIKFQFKGGERILYFDKGDTILLWRAKQNNLIEVMKQLTNNELYPLQVSHTSDQEFVLTISKIKLASL